MVGFKNLSKENKKKMFQKTVIEFFENNYYYMHIYLFKNSFWDEQLNSLFEISGDEYICLKNEFYRDIISNYKMHLNKCYNNQNYSNIDKGILDLLKEYNDLETLFKTVDLVFEHILKTYIAEQLTDIRINTGNQFTSLNDDFFEKYNELCSEFIKYYFNALKCKDEEIDEEIEDDEDDEDVDECDFFDFDEDMDEEIFITGNIKPLDSETDYEELKIESEEFNESLNSLFIEQVATLSGIQEMKNYLNYMLSITCAELMNYEPWEKTGMTAIIKALISLNKDRTFDLTKFCNQNKAAICRVMTHIGNFNNTYDFDTRLEVKNMAWQQAFKSLDKDYLKSFFPTIVQVAGQSDTRAIMNLIDEIITYPNAGIQNILHETDITDLLLDYKLDPRFTEYYRQMIINKIYADVLEYKLYTQKDFCLTDDLDISHICSDFSEHNDDILNSYRKYHSIAPYKIEQIRLFLINNKKVDLLKKISLVSKENYKFITEFKYKKKVDIINDILNHKNEYINIYDDICASLDDNSLNLFIKSMCANVYGNLLNENVLFESQKRIKKIIEEESNLIEMIRTNKGLFTDIYKMLLQYNENGLSYDQDEKIRLEAKEEGKVKILERLYDESN